VVEKLAEKTQNQTLEEVIVSIKEKRDHYQKHIDIHNGIVKPEEYEIGDANNLVNANTQTIIIYENFVAEINLCLEMIEQGKYGICRECGRNIEKERLNLKCKPWATLCILCKEKICTIPFKPSNKKPSYKKKRR